MNEETKEMISYYDLLTMIKDYENKEQYPKVYWHNNIREKVLYVPTFDYVNGQLEGYHIKNRNLESEDIRYWLSECMLESSMFDKCLEIKRKKEKSELQQEISKLQSEIELLSNEIGSYHNKIHSMRDRNNYMKEQLKELMRIEAGNLKDSFEVARKIKELQQENKQLKEKYENAVADYESVMFEKEQLNSLVNSCQEEIRQLKKQLEDYKKLGFKYLQDKNNNLETQQKEFIEYLENMLDDENDIFSVVRVKDVLQKYKSIIGDDK